MVWWIWLLWACVIGSGLYGVWVGLRAGKPPVAVGLLLIATLGAVLRVGSIEGQWYGLEYEDAFVYAAAARHLTGTTRVIGTEGLTVCAVGSVDVCEEWESFPGHLPGVAALFAASLTVVPYRPFLFPVVAGLASTAALLFVWWAALRIYDSFMAANVAATLFAATPVIALYGGSACSESPSAIPIAVVVGASAMAHRAETVGAWWRWQVTALLAFGLGVLCRRENALLGVCAVVFVLRAFVLRVPTWQRGLSMAAWAAAAVATLFILLPSLISEGGEYGQFSFGGLRFLQTVPVVLRALLSPQWFGLAAYCAGAAVAASLYRVCCRRQGASDILVIMVAAIALGMCGLYAAHVRSAYQLAGAPIYPFDFLRYLANVSALLSLAAAGIVTVGTFGLHDRWLVGLTGACFTAYVVASAAQALTLRAGFAQSERVNRHAPSLGAVELVSELGPAAPPVVTLEPLVLQIHAPVGLRFISLPYLRAEHVAGLAGGLLYIHQDHYQSPVDQERYADGISALPAGAGVRMREGDGWAILSLTSR